MNGTVVIGPGFRHSAGLGALLLPHPPVVNQLLSEALAARGDFGSYRMAYRGVTPIPRVIFWSLMGALASAP